MSQLYIWEKPDNTVLRQDGDETFSIPAVTQEDIRWQLFRLDYILNLQVHITYI